jgi:hypothetical protein
MSEKKQKRRRPKFAPQLARYIKRGQHKAIETTLEIVEENADVKVVAVDLPSDSFIFGEEYVEEQEQLLENELKRVEAGGEDSVID